jgi:hypothetical protein
MKEKNEGKSEWSFRMTILSSALNKDNEIDQPGTIGRFVGGGDRERAAVPGEEIQVLVGGFL